MEQLGGPNRIAESVQHLQVDVGVLEGGDEEQPALLVPQQQVLGERTGQVPAQPLAFQQRVESGEVVDPLRRAPQGERRPANLEDVFVLLTGEEIG